MFQSTVRVYNILQNSYFDVYKIHRAHITSTGKQQLEYK